MDENNGGQMVREVREKGGSKNEVKSVNLKIEVSYYVTNHVHSIYKALITFISQIQNLGSFL